MALLLPWRLPARAEKRKRDYTDFFGAGKLIRDGRRPALLHLSIRRLSGALSFLASG